MILYITDCSINSSQFSAYFGTLEEDNKPSELIPNISTTLRSKLRICRNFCHISTTSTTNCWNCALSERYQWHPTQRHNVKQGYSAEGSHNTTCHLSEAILVHDPDGTLQAIYEVADRLNLRNVSVIVQDLLHVTISQYVVINQWCVIYEPK